MGVVSQAKSAGPGCGAWVLRVAVAVVCGVWYSLLRGEWGVPSSEFRAQSLMSLEIQGIFIPQDQQTSSFSNKKMGECQGRAM
jgi:hypothetical protein